MRYFVLHVNMYTSKHIKGIVSLGKHAVRHSAMLRLQIFLRLVCEYELFCRAMMFEHKIVLLIKSIIKSVPIYIHSQLLSHSLFERAVHNTCCHLSFSSLRFVDFSFITSSSTDHYPFTQCHTVESSYCSHVRQACIYLHHQSTNHELHQSKAESGIHWPKMIRTWNELPHIHRTNGTLIIILVIHCIHSRRSCLRVIRINWMTSQLTWWICRDNGLICNYQIAMTNSLKSAKK